MQYNNIYSLNRNNNNTYTQYSSNILNHTSYDNNYVLNNTYIPPNNNNYNTYVPPYNISGTNTNNLLNNTYIPSYNINERDSTNETNYNNYVANNNNLLNNTYIPSYNVNERDNINETNYNNYVANNAYIPPSETYNNNNNVGIEKHGEHYPNQDFIIPLDIHKQYGVIDIPGIKIKYIQVSSHNDKKYSITVEFNNITKTIHYGNSNYQQYEDRTPLKHFSYLDHHDETRRKSYLARSSKITNFTGYACNDPFSPNRYAIITLW